MSNKLMAVCPACPMSFTAKHREQIREMVDDHLLMHYSVLADVQKDKETIERVSKLVEDNKKLGMGTMEVKLLERALEGATNE